MTRGYCVDCNYEGPLAPLGDCPRCGSDWTEAMTGNFQDEDQLAGLYDPKAFKFTESSADLDFTEVG